MFFINSLHTHCSIGSICFYIFHILEHAFKNQCSLRKRCMYGDHINPAVEYAPVRVRRRKRVSKKWEQSHKEISNMVWKHLKNTLKNQATITKTQKDTCRESTRKKYEKWCKHGANMEPKGYNYWLNNKKEASRKPKQKLIAKSVEHDPRSSERLIWAGPCSQPGDYKGVDQLANQPTSQPTSWPASQPASRRPKIGRAQQEHTSEVWFAPFNNSFAHFFGPLAEHFPFRTPFPPKLWYVYILFF